MRVGDKIKMVIEESGETRFYRVERIYGSNLVFRKITEKEAGQGANVVTIKRLHHAK